MSSFWDDAPPDVERRRRPAFAGALIRPREWADIYGDARPQPGGAGAPRGYLPARPLGAYARRAGRRVARYGVLPAGSGRARSDPPAARLLARRHPGVIRGPGRGRPRGVRHA